MRPANALVAGIAAIVGYLMATGTVVPGTLLLLAIVFLVTGAGNAINDYYDAEIDRVNRPERPIPSGSVTEPQALSLSAVLFIAGILLSLFTNPLCAEIAVANSILLVLYAAWLKRTPGLGNAAISYLTASIFLFGGAFSGMDGLVRVIPIALITFLAMLARELWKDAEDLEGDASGGADTVPIRIGVQKTVQIGFFFLMAAILASLVPGLWWGAWYLGGIGIVDLLILAAAGKAFPCRTAECLRRSGATTLVKYAMFASLVVFTLAAVFL
jgi:geranylgeranylglycerol-phosphate geranylgeranyltransferase